MLLPFLGAPQISFNQGYSITSLLMKRCSRVKRNHQFSQFNDAFWANYDVYDCLVKIVLPVLLHTSA